GGDGVLSRPRYDAAVQRAAVGAPRRITMFLAAATLALLAGCTTSTTTPSPSRNVATPTPTPPTASPGPTAAPTPGQTRPGQSDTDWERIWNDAPADFPAYPAARPTETGAGPASAILDAGTSRPAQVTEFYRSAFAAAGFSIVSRDGPREDGSYELLVSGPGGCHIRVTTTPLGGSTI